MKSNWPRNIRLYVLIGMLEAAWFAEGVWFFYWHQYTTYTLLGTLFALGSVLAMLLEIPTGVFADKYGRKKAVVLGMLGLAGGGYLIALGNHIGWLCFGLYIQVLGRAFISGAFEALAYDSLKEKGREHEFEMIQAKRTQLIIIAFAMASSLGGFLYNLHMRLPNLLMATCYLMGLILTFGLKEPKIISEVDKKKPKLLAALAQLIKPGMKPFIISGMALMTLYLVYDWGFLKPALAVNFGLYAKGQGMVYALGAIISTIFLGYLPKLRSKVGDLSGMWLLIAIAALGILIALFPIGLWGIGVIFLIEMVSNSTEIWISVTVNKQLKSEFRATALSAIQMVGRVPFLVLNIWMGAMIDQGRNKLVFATLAISLLSVVLLDIIRNRRWRYKS